MLSHQCKRTINNSQDNMPSIKPSAYATISPEKCNIVESQDKIFKIVIINMFKDLNLKVTFVSSEEGMRSELYPSWENTWLGLSPDNLFSLLIIPRPRHGSF